MRRTEGYIPRNLGAGTFADGRFKARNAVEGIIIAVVLFFLTKPLDLFLPMLISWGIRGVIVLGGFALGVAGGDGQPLSVFLMDIYNYSNSRTYVTLRPPQREVSAEKKKSKAGKEKKEKKKLTDYIFVKSPEKKSEKKKKKKK